MNMSRQDTVDIGSTPGPVDGSVSADNLSVPVGDVEALPRSSKKRKKRDMTDEEKMQAEEQRKESWRAHRKSVKERKKARKAAAAASAAAASGQTSETTAAAAAVMGGTEGSSSGKPKKKDLVPATGDLVIDLDFEDHMSERDLRSMSVQLGQLYGANRRSQTPFRLRFCGLGPTLTKSMEKMNAGNWKNVSLHSAPFTAPPAGHSESPTAAGSGGDGAVDEEKSAWKERLVYLSADSDTVLDGPLDPDAVYVIGGLVDHNKLKGHCQQKAQGLGIRTAQLPISTYFEGQTRRVISVNQVAELLLRVRESGDDWQSSIGATLPARKKFQPKKGSKNK